MAAAVRTTQPISVTPLVHLTQGILKRISKTKIEQRSVSRVPPRSRRNSEKRTRQKCPRKRYRRNRIS